MKEENAKSKKGLVYYIVLGVCIALLIAATVLTVYFATRRPEAVVEAPPAQDQDIGGQPSDNGPADPGDNKPSENTPTVPDQPSGGEDAVQYVFPIDNTDYLVEYNSIYANLTAKRWYRHKAVDFAAEAGTRVCSMADGTVTRISPSKELGNLIVVDHGGGLQTYYRFIEAAPSLTVGMKVSAGQTIGEVAEAYGAEAHDGTHLHFEVWQGGNPVDPDTYLDIALGEK